MSGREKNLLFALLGMAALIGLIYLGLSHRDTMSELVAKRDRLKFEAASAEGQLVFAEELAMEAEWLNSLESEPLEYSEAMTDLQKFVSDSSESFGFDTYGVKLFNIDGAGGHFRSAQVVINAKATNLQLIQWLCLLHSPKELRAVTSLKMIPDSKDEDLIVCQVSVERWFVEKTQED